MTATKRTSPNGPDDFDIEPVSGFLGYVSSVDTTTADARVLVRGCLNVYKKISGTVANRFGRKLYDVVDTTVATIVSGFVWNNSVGNTFPIRACSGKLQFYSTITGTGAWYTLLSGLTLLRFVFDSVWDTVDAISLLYMVNGDFAKMWRWTGGIGLLASTSTATGQVATAIVDAGGTSYLPGDVLTITGGGGIGATVQVTAVAAGVITGVTLLTPGSGYSATTSASTSGGSGTSATITITVGNYSVTLDRNPITAGFALLGDLNINGNDYSYKGIVGDSFVGLSANPAAEPAKSVVFQQIVTITQTQFTAGPSATYACDFIKIVDSQLYLGSYTSQVIFLSRNTNPIDFSFSSPRLPGEGDQIILDDPARGIGETSQGAAVFYGTSHLALITFAQSTVGLSTGGLLAVEATQQTKILLGENVAALAHEFIDGLADNIIYLDQANQLRAFGTFNNAFTAKSVLLSQDVQTELAEQDFTGGQLKIVSDQRGDMTYITSPATGQTYLYQERSSLNSLGNVVAEKIWQPPQSWDITRIDAIGGRTVGFSQANPQIYYLWDTGQYSDDAPMGQVPYESILLLSYQNGGRRQGKMEFDKVYWEGYFTQDTNLYGAVYLDYQGATSLLPVIINDPTSALIVGKQVFSGVNPPSLGDASLGDDPLGDGLDMAQDDQATLPKFRVITGVQLIQCFEWALMAYSSNLGARWEMLALGTNATLAASQGVELLK